MFSTVGNVESRLWIVEKRWKSGVFAWKIEDQTVENVWIVEKRMGVGTKTVVRIEFQALWTEMGSP